MPPKSKKVQNAIMKLVQMMDKTLKIEDFNSTDTDSGSSDSENDHYYVHIDVLKNCSSKVARSINKHMIEGGCYDPRRGTTFPKDLLEKNDGKFEDLFLYQKRALAGGRGETYYELWKVPKGFSLEEFNEKIIQLNAGVVVQMVQMVGSGHTITKFYGENER